MTDAANSGGEKKTKPYWADVQAYAAKHNLPIEEAFFMLQYRRRDGSVATGWFKRPEFHAQPHIVYARVLNNYRSNKVLEAGQCVLADCWVAGDADFQDMKSLVHITAARDLTNYVDFLEQVEQG